MRPGDPTTMLAGTGGAGIFRSGDGGASWMPSQTGLPVDLMIAAIAFAPSAPDTVYAATREGGAVRSNDGGRSWQQVWSDSSVVDVAVDAFDHRRVVVTAFIGVYLSTDGGATWRELLRAWIASRRSACCSPHRYQAGSTWPARPA